MPYLITYRKANETHNHVLDATNGWSEPAIREAFAGQYPQAEILAVTPRG